MNVTTEQATVYRGGGRRFFTKHAAYRSAAKALLRERMEPEEYGELVSPNCRHDDGCDCYEPLSAIGRKFVLVVSAIIRYMKWRDGMIARPRRVTLPTGLQEWSTKPPPRALRCEIMAALGLPQGASLADVKKRIAQGGSA